MSLAGLPEDVVIFSGEPVSPVTASQDARRLVLAVTAIRRVGSDRRAKEFLPDGTTKTTWTGQRVVTLSVRAENYGTEEGYELLEDLRTQLETPEIGELLNVSGFAVNSTQNVTVLDVNAGNRAISVAVLDVMLNWASVRTETKVVVGDYIETVETTGQDDLARAGVVKVPDP